MLLNSPNQFLLFSQALDQFEAVFIACLQEKLDFSYAQKISDFVDTWSEAKLPNSSKFHILKFHIIDFIRLTGHPLGRYGEQATETVHFDFGQTWHKIKVPESSDLYSNNLRRAVVMYNSHHL